MSFRQQRAFLECCGLGKLEKDDDILAIPKDKMYIATGSPPIYSLRNSVEDDRLYSCLEKAAH